jgi:proteic killer suppression protein
MFTVTWHVTCYTAFMIVTFKHKGLELYAQKGDRSKLPNQQIARIRLILTRLDSAKSPVEMNQPGYHFHQLSGNLRKFYSVRVTGNYRIIFRFDGENIFDVDYVDYH